MDIVNQLFGIVFKDGKGDKKIERLGHEFAGLVPELEFSPEEVLSLLLEHRKSPESAIAGVEAWVAKAREEKRNKLKREGSWVYSE
jgi:chaperone BCS1